MRPTTAPEGLRVFAYRNLHKGCWSLKALEGPQRGRVVAHVAAVTLTGCELRVSEAGRQRVLREGRKNVHAGVVGRVERDPRGFSGEGAKLSYNPRRGPSFTVGETPVSRAALVSLENTGRCMGWL